MQLFSKNAFPRLDESMQMAQKACFYEKTKCMKKIDQLLLDIHASALSFQSFFFQVLWLSYSTECLIFRIAMFIFQQLYSVDKRSYDLP